MPLFQDHDGNNSLLIDVAHFDDETVASTRSFASASFTTTSGTSYKATSGRSSWTAAQSGSYRCKPTIYNTNEEAPSSFTSLPGRSAGSAHRYANSTTLESIAPDDDSNDDIQDLISLDKPEVEDTTVTGAPSDLDSTVHYGSAEQIKNQSIEQIKNQNIRAEENAERVTALEQMLARANLNQAEAKAQADWYKLQLRQLHLDFEDLQAFCDKLQEENKELRQGRNSRGTRIGWFKSSKHPKERRRLSYVNTIPSDIETSTVKSNQSIDHDDATAGHSTEEDDDISTVVPGKMGEGYTPARQDLFGRRSTSATASSVSLSVQGNVDDGVLAKSSSCHDQTDDEDGKDESDDDKSIEIPSTTNSKQIRRGSFFSKHRVRFLSRCASISTDELPSKARRGSLNGSDGHLRSSLVDLDLNFSCNGNADDKHTNNSEQGTAFQSCGYSGSGGAQGMMDGAYKTNECVTEERQELKEGAVKQKPAWWNMGIGLSSKSATKSSNGPLEDNQEFLSHEGEEADEFGQELATFADREADDTMPTDISTPVQMEDETLYQRMRCLASSDRVKMAPKELIERCSSYLSDRLEDSEKREGSNQARLYCFSDYSEYFDSDEESDSEEDDSDTQEEQSFARSVAMSASAFATDDPKEEEEEEEEEEESFCDPLGVIKAESLSLTNETIQRSSSLASGDMRRGNSTAFSGMYSMD